MKKFLTVLLVIAVMFTFSFSSAFAATADEYTAKVYEAQNQVTRTFEAAYTNALASLAATDGSGYPIPKDAWVTGAAAYKDAQITLIQKRTADLLASAAVTALKDSATVTGLVGLYAKLTSEEIYAGANPSTDPATVVVTDILSGIAAMTKVDGTGAKDVAYRLAFDAYKATVIAAMNSVNTAIFSTTEPEDEDALTEKERADKFVAEEVAKVQAIVIDADATASEVVTALAKIGKLGEASYDTDTKVYAFTGGTNGNGTDIVYSKYFVKVYDSLDVDNKVALEYRFLDHNKIWDSAITVPAEAVLTTAEAELAADASEEAIKAAYKANLATEIADLRIAALAITDATQKANISKFIEDFTAVQTYLIENSKKTDGASTLTFNGSVLEKVSYASNPSDFTLETAKAADSKYSKNVVAYAALEKYAAKMGAQYDETGALIRDAAKIEKVLKDAKKTIYGAAGAWNKASSHTVTGINTTPATYENIIKDSCGVANDVASYDRERAIEVVKAALKTKLYGADTTIDYYEPEAAAVTALYEAQIEAIKAAATTAELDKAIAATPKAVAVDAIKNKTAVQAAINAAVGNYFDGSTKELDTYAAYAKLQKGNESTFDAAYVAAFGGTTGVAPTVNNMVDWFAKQGARTADQVKAQVSNAKAVIDAIPTKAALANELTEVNAKIDAISATVTVADKDAILGAQDAVKAYKDKTTDTAGLKDYLLNIKITGLKAALEKEITTATKALPTKATVADKAAFQAVEDLIKAYNKVVEDYEFAGWTKMVVASGNYQTVDNGLKAIKALEKEAVEDAIDALPLNITAANKEAVEAARVAYDAYVAEYSDPETDVDARTDFAADYLKTLKNAEDVLADLYAESILSVETLKITASSTRGTGYIKVKWNVVGDNSKVESYEIWKSTKKNSGFKKAFTTTKTTYKNTKGLKSGVRYYFKVRAIAFDTDGTKIKSDWSNKAIRIAK